MPKEPPKTAADFIPDRPTLTNARDAAKDCKGCDLWMRGTQTVFGEGSRKAELMLVGEQPGDAEDLSGHPFVGPAGKLLDRALADAGIDRTAVNQGGFSQTTNLTPSLDNGLTFRATLANPFPDGFQVPSGASSGLTTVCFRL